ncbi:excinuclease ABC subunit UvrA [TM7 phylum sp. oral taxon 350]|nr:excinuclease ABC subunit UvrA [TM7 phylum sp. oral taxon 350]
MSDNVIKIIGAREHNLKNIDVEIPRDKLVVITGLSGSGKSSLAFDTIYAEGQRRYVESLSSYARQFLGLMEKPDVDQITGLSPAIAIDQKSTSRNPRSTVATVTEIYDYLRLLFARVGTPHCPVCNKEVKARSSQSIIDEILNLPEGDRYYILAPIVKDKKGEFIHVPEQYMRLGFARVRVDGVVYALDEFPDLEKNKRHNIEIVIDRVLLSKSIESRLSQSIEQALETGSGFFMLLNAETNKITTYSKSFACPDHPEIEIPNLEPRLFSFNSPIGACPTCSGLGFRMEVDPSLVLNPNLTISEGAIRAYNRANVDSWYITKIAAVGERFGFSVREPVRNISDENIFRILYGTDKEIYKLKLHNGRTYNATYEGVIPNLERRYRESDSEFIRKDIERFMRELECSTCHGKRLKSVVLAVTVFGKSIIDIVSMSVSELLAVLYEDADKLSLDQKKIADSIIKEIHSRLSFMQDVGLGYLTLARAANTLSGGEAQRIRLATQIGAGLQGVLYVLDEPSIGLHQRDNDRLISTLKHLRDLGNTVLVVEHDEDTIRQADYLLDIGPGAGEHGGYVVASGTPEVVSKNEDSITGRYLSGKDKIPVPKNRRKIDSDRKLIVKNAYENNLKNIDVEIPLGVMTVVTGVSGSGKSTLVNDIIANELQARLMRAKTIAGHHDDILNINLLDKAVVIDQSAIGKTPRSNPATYTGVFTAIRELFASTPEANIRGYKAGRFSFNIKGGRCENCQGDGIIKIEMHFLPDVYTTCSECHGKRYNKEALQVTYKGKNISDVLEMTVSEATEFFSNLPNIHRKLSVLKEVGLGYIRLGQSATTFSGGEAQRIKLATELAKKPTGKTIYILDEPTTGLHSADVKKLLAILNKLVDNKNTVLIIEHNLDVIKTADHIIDLGPEGGANGGTILATGTPEKIAESKNSYTGKYLRKLLK